MLIDTNLVLIILFWIAPAIVIIFNLLWDIEFLQRKEYQLQRIYQTLRWDSEFTHRHKLQLVIKIALFTATTLFILSKSSLIPAVAALLAFAWWINEALEVIAKLIGHRRPGPKLDIRGVSILYLSILLLAVIPVLIAASIPSTPTPLTKLVITDTGNIIPIDTPAGTVIPAAYAALIFSTLLALAYDLAVPFIVIVFTILTYPFAWLWGQWLIWRAKRKLAAIPSLAVIAIATSAEHPHVKPMISRILEQKFRVVALSEIETSSRGLAHSVLQHVRPNTEVLVVELNAWQKGQMGQLCGVIRPHISVLPGIDDAHLGAFGTVDLTLEAKSELIRATRATGTVVFNADDELVSSLVRTTAHKEIICTNHKQRISKFSDNELTVDYYLATPSHDSTELEHASGEIAVSGITKAASLDLAIATAAAIEAGAELDEIPTAMQGYQAQELLPQTYEGDLGSTIWDFPTNPRYRQFLQILELISQLPEGKQRILITKGVSDLRHYKAEVHKELASRLNKLVDVLITPDIHLAHSAKSANIRTQIFPQENISHTIYHVREVMQRNAQIILVGETHPQILHQLRSETR